MLCRDWAAGQEPKLRPDSDPEGSGTAQVGCAVSRLVEPVLVLRVEGLEEVRCRELEDLADRRDPRAPAALLKCAAVVAGVIDVAGSPLVEQLAGGGLEVTSWSRVPTGSGLGTSSILAACLVAAFRAARDEAYALDDAARGELVDATLAVEAELTTGRGPARDASPSRCTVRRDDAAATPPRRRRDDAAATTPPRRCDDAAATTPALQAAGGRTRSAASTAASSSRRRRRGCPCASRRVYWSRRRTSSRAASSWFIRVFAAERTSCSMVMCLKRARRRHGVAATRLHGLSTS